MSSTNTFKVKSVEKGIPDSNQKKVDFRAMVLPGILKGQIDLSDEYNSPNHLHI